MLRRWPLLGATMVSLLTSLLPPGPALAREPAALGRLSGQLAGIQLPFIANEGQVDARVAYYAPTFAGTLFVTRQGEIVYGLATAPTGARRDPRRSETGQGWSLTETWPGGRARPVGQDRST